MFDLKTVALVAVIALLIYAIIRWRNGQPTTKDTLNDAFAHPEPVHKTPLEHIVEKCVPKPPSPEELRAVVDEHNKKAAGPAAVPTSTTSGPAKPPTPGAGSQDSPQAGSAEDLLKTILQTK